LHIGCTKKYWKVNDFGIALGKPAVKPSGKVLDDGACVGDEYSKTFLPISVERTVNITFEYQKVRGVDAKKQTLSLDLTLRVMWTDPDLKFKFSIKDQQRGAMLLSPDAISEIWTPDVHIENRTYFKLPDERESLISSKILGGGTNQIELIYEIKTTVYCHFEYSNYPMDQQKCYFNILSASQSVIFVLDPAPGDSDGVHQVNAYQAENFNMKIQFFDNEIKNGNNTIGIMIEMCRLQTSFLYMYYIPCMTIVLVSLIGFVIPVTAIPGRVGLLVTQFLTLTNLSIHQMVSINTFNLHRKSIFRLIREYEQHKALLHFLLIF
jgi:hypothetical protein